MPEHATMERVVRFDCEGDALMGVVHAAPGDIGVLVIVGGPQYRAGSHRQFLRLARALAASGYPAMRFDVRGMGDSEGAPRSFEHTGQDIAAAIDTFHREVPSLRRIVLLGLCDGASAALLYLQSHADHRVGGLCLMNPWVRSAVTLASARVKHYYVRRVLQRDFWAKLLRGSVSLKAPLDFIRAVGTARARPARAAASFQDRMLLGWAGFDGASLLVLSENDITAQEFVQVSRNDGAWSAVLESPRVERHDLLDADHTFSSNASHLAVIAKLLSWLSRLERETQST